MTDRIDPGPGWRLLEIGEIRPVGYQYLSSEGLWSDGDMVGVIVATSGGVCRVRVYRKGATKAIATRATVRGVFPDGAATSHSIECKTGLSPEMMAFASARWEVTSRCLPESSAKYIMLEIQREGEP